MVARGYAPRFVRFMRGPLADEYPGWSPYVYPLNNPLRYNDPTGMCPEDDSAGENQFALVRTPNPYAVGAGLFLLGGAIVADHFIDLTPGFESSLKLSVGKSIDWNNAPSSPDELSDEWSEVPSMAPNRREFVNDRTGEEVSFDKGQPSKPGWAGRDHWHRKNPNSTSERDMYLDKNGNPVPRNHNRSHIPSGGK